MESTEENSSLYLENKIIKASEQILQLARQVGGKESSNENRELS